MKEKCPENITWMFSERYSWKTCYCYRYSCVGLTELKWNNDNLGEIIFRLWQAFDYIGLSEWQLSWTIFFRNLPWKVNFVMAKFLWIVRVSIKLMYISMYICVAGGFHLFIVYTSTRTIRYSDSTLFFLLQSSPTNQETPKYFARNNCKSFSKESTPNASIKIDRHINILSFWNDTCKCFAKYYICQMAIVVVQAWQARGNRSKKVQSCRRPNI